MGSGRATNSTGGFRITRSWSNVPLFESCLPCRNLLLLLLLQLQRPEEQAHGLRHDGPEKPFGMLECWQLIDLASQRSLHLEL